MRMRTLFTGMVLLAAWFAAPPLAAQGTIPSWGEIAPPAEARALRQTVVAQAGRLAVNAQVLDRLARHLGGRYRSMGPRELERRVVGLAERLSEAERSEQSLRASFARLPPSARAQLERGWAFLREGRPGDALVHLRRAEGIVRATGGITSEEYLQVVSLTATILEMQQGPRAASDSIRAALGERAREFRESQVELAEQAFATELRWAREQSSADAATRALQLLRDYQLLDGRPLRPGEVREPVSRRQRIRNMFSGAVRRCDVADLYFIRSGGRDRQDLQAGLAMFTPPDMVDPARGGENWQCRSILARLEVQQGIAASDPQPILRGLDRLESILRYWGEAGSCPLGFENYGPAIYRVGIALRDHVRRGRDPALTARLARFQETLRYARASLLPIPAPVNLHAYLAEIGIQSGTF